MPRIFVKSGKRETNRKVKNDEGINGQRADEDGFDQEEWQQCVKKMPVIEVKLDECAGKIAEIAGIE